jgi:hypothetical protein
MGFRAAARGSEEWARTPAFCALPVVARPREKNVSDGATGGGRGTVVKPSSVIGVRGSRAPSWHTRREWSSGRGHSSVRGRRVRPPQVGVRRGRGASISEAARSPSEGARSVTAEGLSMSPLPRVPAGRFRRSGTRGLVEAAERLVRRLWSSGDPAIIGSVPCSDPLRPRRWLAHPVRAASESRCRPATSGA